MIVAEQFRSFVVSAFNVNGSASTHVIAPTVGASPPIVTLADTSFETSAITLGPNAAASAHSINKNKDNFFIRHQILYFI